MKPDMFFRCVPLHCTMMAKRCVERQDKTDWNDAAVYPGCVVCKLGVEIRSQLPGYQPAKPSASPFVLSRLRTDKPQRVIRGCQLCGEHVELKKNRYCSRECAGMAKRKYSEGHLTGKSCVQCGEPIPMYINHLGYVDLTISMQRRFCGRSCGAKYNRGKTKPQA